MRNTSQSTNNTRSEWPFTDSANTDSAKRGPCRSAADAGVVLGHATHGILSKGKNTRQPQQTNNFPHKVLHHVIYTHSLNFSTVCWQLNLANSNPTETRTATCRGLNTHVRKTRAEHA
jgi:hypothetical protein